MIVILSPAKTLEFEKTIPYDKHTVPQFLQESKQLISILKKKSTQEIAKLMELSDNLAQLNVQRYKEWKTPFTPKNARPAIFTYNGPVYHGFDFLGYKPADYERAQKTIRIISGLYGLLRPLDLIQAYRLEMISPLQNPKGKDLYAFWKEKVTNEIDKECKDMLIDLTSKAYGSVVDHDKLQCKVITPVFKNYRKGKFMVMGLLAKKARGLCANYIVQHNVQTVEQLKKFNAQGYQFDPKTSTQTELVFLKK